MHTHLSRSISQMSWCSWSWTTFLRGISSVDCSMKLPLISSLSWSSTGRGDLTQLCNMFCSQPFLLSLVSTLRFCMARFAPKRKWSVASSNGHPNQPSASKSRCHSPGSAGNAHLRMKSFPSFSVFERRGSQIFGQQPCKNYCRWGFDEWCMLLGHDFIMDLEWLLDVLVTALQPSHTVPVPCNSHCCRVVFSGGELLCALTIATILTLLWNDYI